MALRTFGYMKVIILNKLAEGHPNAGELPKRGFLALRELEDDGLVVIDSYRGPFQDPGAGPDEGDVPMYSAKARITAAGRQFIKDNRLDELWTRKTRTAASRAAAKGRAKKAAKRNPSSCAAARRVNRAISRL